MPCTDVVSCDVNGSQEHHTHSHSDHEEDTCPPFCACHCCGIVITFQELVAFTLVHLEHLYDYQYTYSDNYTYDHSWSLWHPPLAA